ncbi:MAG: hypothetical protein JJT90_16830 [Ectothiorhodospiraceae bacterium]|nr:hypothetical protein [Ectothiorhodospiraceae bacterium]
MNPNLATWEMVLVGMLAALLVMWFLPGIRASMKRAEEQQEKDWRGALLPLLMVALFVMVLIMLV